MSWSKLSLPELALRLSQRDLLILQTLHLHRLMDGNQLRRLFFSEGVNEESQRRAARRRLAQLEQLGLASRLRRRVGGVRGGSGGTIWQVSAHGQRLLAFVSGEGIGRPRGPYEPGEAYVAHTLACSEVFVGVHEAEHAGQLELLEYQAEPACWRPFIGDVGQPLTLKPDGFVAAAVGEFEERAFIEVDMASHGSPALRRKLRVYVDYQRSGLEQRGTGVFPRVFWATPSAARQAVLAGLIAELPDDAVGTHHAAPLSDVVDVLTRKGSQLINERR